MAEQELTLGDIIRLLINRWKILSALFFGALIVIFVFTLSLADMYSAESVLLVVNSKLRSKQMTQDYLGVTVDSYLSMICNKQMLGDLLEKLRAYKASNPKSPIPEKMKFRDFAKRIQVEDVANSQCIRIRVHMEDPELATEFANEIARRAVADNFDLLGRDTSDSVQYIQSKINSSSNELELAYNDLLNFRLRARLEELDQDIQIAFGQQSGWKVEKESLEISIKETERKAVALREEMDSHPERKKLKRVITESPEFIEIMRGKQPSATTDSILSLGMDVEILNPVYSTAEAGLSEASVDLSGKREKLQILEVRLRQVQEQLDKLLKDKHEKSLQLERKELRRTLAKQQYERYETWQSDVDAVVASERQDLRIIDRAIVPDKPVGPKRPLLAGVAAIIVGLVAFFAFLARDIYHMI